MTTLLAIVGLVAVLVVIGELKFRQQEEKERRQRMNSEGNW